MLNKILSSLSIEAPPLFVLFILFSTQLMIYVDRGLMAAFVSVLQQQLYVYDNNDYSTGNTLSDTSMGFLGSGFVLGYMISCPIFAYLAKTRQVNILMCIGLITWCIAIVICSISYSFNTMLLGRILTGIGEASFAGLAPTVIDDIAPHKHRTQWLSVFYAALPVGGAIGYVVGGFLAITSWRLGFIGESIIMIPLIILLYIIQPLDRQHNKHHQTAQSIDDSNVQYTIPRSHTLPYTKHTQYHTIQMRHDIDDLSETTSSSSERSDIDSKTPLINQPRNNAPTIAKQTDVSDDMLLPLSLPQSQQQQQQFPNTTTSNRSLNKTVQWALPYDQQSTSDDSIHSFRPTAKTSLIRVNSAPHIDPTNYAENDLLTDIVILLSDSIYLCIVLGMSSLTFVIGALSFWGPANYAKLLSISERQASSTIGGITLICGIVGTYAGGVMLDYMGGGYGKYGIGRAMTLSSICVACSILFAVISVSSDSPHLSFASLTLADFCMFASSAPVNGALLSSTPNQLRGMGMALSILLMHALGDLPSPLIVGYISDITNDTRLTMLIMCGWSCFSVLFWSIAAILIKQKINRYKQHTKHKLLHDDDDDEDDEHEEIHDKDKPKTTNDRQLFDITT